jgi:uncharacterized membrane protein
MNLSRAGWRWSRLDLGLVAIVLLVALLLRIGWLLWAPVFIGGDSLQYYQPVHDYLRGQGFTLSLKRPPLYTWLIIGSHALFGPSFVPIIAIQHVMGAAVAVMVFAIGAMIFGRWAGFVAGLFAAITSPMMRWEHFLMSEALFIFTTTLAVTFMVVGLRRDRAWVWVVTGLVLGFSVLSRSAGQILLVALPPMLLVLQPWRRAVVNTLIVGVAFAVVTVPWMSRNSVVHGAFTTAGAAGQNLITYTAIIHRPDFSFEEPLVTALDADPKKATARKIVQKAMEDKIAKPQLDTTGLGIHNRIMDETRMGQAQADAVMREIAVRAILARPWTYIRNTLEDVVTIFQGGPHDVDDDLRTAWDLWQSRGWRGPMARYIGPATAEQEASYGRVAAIDGLYHPKNYWIPIGVFFAIGIAVAIVDRRRRSALLVAGVAVALVVISAATVGAVPRYRLPPDPFINVVAVGGLVFVAQAIATRLRAKAPNRMAAPAPLDVPS